MTLATGSQIVKNADLPEMIERVARAIVRARHRTCCQDRDINDFPIGAYEIEEACAAIFAMAEPTEEMISAGMKEAAVDLASKYRATIQAALGDSVPDPVQSQAPGA